MPFRIETFGYRSFLDYLSLGIPLLLFLSSIVLLTHQGKVPSDITPGHTNL
jgi:hypothetical protein